MKFQFEESMTKLSDAELLKIVNSPSEEYQLDAIYAADQEIKKRELAYKEIISKYSNDQIIEIIGSRNEYRTLETQAAETEAKKRNLKFNYDDYEKSITQTEISYEIDKLKKNLSDERYSALNFLSGAFKFLAWIILLVSVASFIYIISQEQFQILFAVGELIVGGILFLALLAISECIKLLVDIEHNTRITAMNSKI